jgi:Protein kinase domain
VKALEPGDIRQVGKYRLLGELGSGGMGRVFLGESPGGRLVAVKLIRAELSGNPDFRVRFAREVATARTVSGIFTAPVVDADLDGSQPWLVTAYVEGPSLADAVAAAGPLSGASVLQLAAGLAEGLGVIHAAGVVHRDLKPSNVLLAGDGPRIIDFGISRAADATALTRAGGVTGSPGFMSPEQVEGGDAGPASDVFSLGAVLAFAATGEAPFGTGPATVLHYRVVHGAPATSRVPGGLRALVECCLAKDPRQRPTTDQILDGLRAARPAAARPAHPGGRAAPAMRLAGMAASPLGREQTEPVRLPGPPSAGPAAGLPTATSVPRPRAHPTPTRPGGQEPGAARPPSPRRGSAPARWAAGAVAAALAVAAVTYAAYRPAAAPAATHQVPAAPPSWARHQDPGEFSISLPPGWTANYPSAAVVHFTGSPRGFVVDVAWTTHPEGDQLADWKEQSSARSGSDPTYQPISIRRVFYRGYDAADWEFSEVREGRLTRVIDRGFIARPGRLAYAIELYGPAAEWPAVYARLWPGLVRTFEGAR